jgi:hypothetical protein
MRLCLAEIEAAVDEFHRAGLKCNYSLQFSLQPPLILGLMRVKTTVLALVVGGQTVVAMVGTTPGYARLKPISIALKIETNESYGIAMPKGSPLNAKINEALKDLMDSGEVVSIIQTHIK